MRVVAMQIAVPAFVVLIVMVIHMVEIVAAQDVPPLSDEMMCGFECEGEAPVCVAMQEPSPGAADASFSVAFVGDQGVNTVAASVLAAFAAQGTDMLVVAGDMGYSEGSQAAWRAQIVSALGRDVDVLTTIGNHDWNADWTEAEAIRAGFHTANATGRCLGQSAVSTTCHFPERSLTVALVAPGLYGNNGAAYVAQAFLRFPARWRICVFHYNQRLMQTGGKHDQAGWDVYDTCRRYGALVITGHEHSYARSVAMTEFETQSLLETPPDPAHVPLRAASDDAAGVSAAIVTGLGGRSVRAPQDNREHNPWWAATLNAATVPATRNGGVWCNFTQATADCVFLEDTGTIRDTFRIEAHTDPSGGDLPPAGDSTGEARTLWDAPADGTRRLHRTVASDGIVESGACLVDDTMNVGTPGSPVLHRFADLDVNPATDYIESAYLVWVAAAAASGPAVLRVRTHLGPSAPLECTAGIPDRLMSDAHTFPLDHWPQPLRQEYLDVTPLLRDAIAVQGWDQYAAVVLEVVGTTGSTARTVLGPGHTNRCSRPMLVLEVSKNRPPSPPPPAPQTPPPSPPPSPPTAAAARVEDKTSATEINLAMLVLAAGLVIGVAGVCVLCDTRFRCAGQNARAGLPHGPTSHDLSHSV